MRMDLPVKHTFYSGIKRSQHLRVLFVGKAKKRCSQRVWLQGHAGEVLINVWWVITAVFQLRCAGSRILARGLRVEIASTYA